MIRPTHVEHAIVHRDRWSYCAHPQAILKRDKTIAMVFNRAPRRDQIMHPPQDPMFMNVVSHSCDDGVTWSTPEVAPSYGWTGTETASLTELADGAVMLNQWQGRWLPLSLARRMPREDIMAFPDRLMAGWASSPEFAGAAASQSADEFAPWVRAGGKTYVHLSQDGGRSFSTTVEIATAPLIGGYGNRGAFVLPSGKIILPLTDVYNFKTVFVVESLDNGLTWSEPRIIAQHDGSEFEEPAPFITKSGRLLMMLRDNGRRLLHQVDSCDEGKTWSSPRQLPLQGYPAHLLQLEDGRILMTYGWRFPDFGIQAICSEDEGKSWSNKPILIRDNMKNRNLGYPVTLPVRDRSLLTIYYGEEEDGVTSIMSTRWRLPA